MSILAPSDRNASSDGGAPSGGSRGCALRCIGGGRKEDAVRFGGRYEEGCEGSGEEVERESEAEGAGDGRVGGGIGSDMANVCERRIVLLHSRRLLCASGK